MTDGGGERAWLIEAHRLGKDGKAYYVCRGGLTAHGYAWTPDPNRAFRLAREREALTVIRMLAQCGFSDRDHMVAREHVFREGVYARAAP